MKKFVQQRLRRRAGFGSRPDEAGHDTEREPEAWLEAQLAPIARPTSTGTGSEPGTGFADLERQRHPLGPEMRREMRREMRQRSRETARRIAGERLVRAVRGVSPLREVMIDFWANHFAVDARTSFVGAFLPHYEHAVLEPYALGRFGDLLLAVARSPAMLVYLDNWKSTKPRDPRRHFGLHGRAHGGINENYARELLELHTLGIDGGYTQQDVIEVARILTGWGVSREGGGRFRFAERHHDAGSKQVLGTRYRDDGVQQGVLLLSRLAQHPATARHVSRKLVRRFVADLPPPALVERASRRFLETEGDVAQVLRTVLLSPEFADPANRKLKTPLRFTISALRETGGDTDGGRRTLLALARLGELPFFPGSPAGFPEDEARWIDPGAMLERMRFAFVAAHGWIPGLSLGSGLPSIPASDGVGLSWNERIALAIASPEFQWA